MADHRSDIHHRHRLSREFWAGMAAVLLFALLLTGAGALAASRNAEPFRYYDTGDPLATVAMTHVPRKTTPPDNFTRLVPPWTGSATATP